MSDKKVRGLIIFASFIMIFSGVILYLMFDKQGFGKNTNGNYVNLDVNDYVEISPISFNNYNDVYDSINVSRVDIKNIDNELISDFISKEEKIINYIHRYYNQIINSDNITANNSVNSMIKAKINGAVLSVFYRVDFKLDETIFEDNNKVYMVTLNIDLATNKVLVNDNLLSKYSYSKKYIAEKLFNEDILIDSGQIVIDKNTNISLTKGDVERRKNEYINEIISEFDNIIYMYIEDGSLVLIYDSKELKELFFDNKFETEIKVRYLK